MTDPTPPTGVALIDQDGQRHPVDVVYLGRGSDGTALFAVVTNLDPDVVTGVHVDVFPGRTAIAFPWQLPDDLAAVYAARLTVDGQPDSFTVSKAIGRP